MAHALCKLQLELQHSSHNLSRSEASVKVVENQEAKCEDFGPKTPVSKEVKRKYVIRMKGADLLRKFSDIEQDLKVDVSTKMEGQVSVENGNCLHGADVLVLHLSS